MMQTDQRDWPFAVGRKHLWADLVVGGLRAIFLTILIGLSVYVPLYRVKRSPEKQLFIPGIQTIRWVFKMMLARLCSQPIRKRLSDHQPIT